MKLERGRLSGLRKVLSCWQVSTVLCRLFPPLQRGAIAQVGRRQVFLIRNAIKGDEPHQTRGIVMIDSLVSFVACTPLGMGRVASVIITAQVGKILHEGEKLGYFHVCLNHRDQDLNKSVFDLRTYILMTG